MRVGYQGDVDVGGSATVPSRNLGDSAYWVPAYQIQGSNVKRHRDRRGEGIARAAIPIE